MMEDHALSLLKESLAGKSKGYDFKIGNAGVGFCLGYIISKEFVEADCEERHEKIVSHIMIEYAIVTITGRTKGIPFENVLLDRIARGARHFRDDLHING